jgi:hypothetical protein
VNTDTTPPPAFLVGVLPLPNETSPGADAPTCRPDQKVRYVDPAVGIFASRNSTRFRGAARSFCPFAKRAFFDDLSSWADLGALTSTVHFRVLKERLQIAGETADADETLLARSLRVLERWRGLLAPHHFEAMLAHLRRLLGDEEELAEDGICLSVASLDDLLCFLAGRTWARAPAAGMNKAGQFSISWTSRNSQTDITLTFLGDSKAKWYAYGLGRHHTGSVAGTSEVRELGAILTGLGCDSWMADEG